MTKLILVRHGESQANRNGIFAGNFDADLEERGIHQAKATAEYIKNTYSVDALYASDLKRAFKTGQCIGEALNLEPIAEKNIREIAAGKWDGEKFDVIIEKYPEQYKVWKEDTGSARPTEGESVPEMKERIMNAFEKIAKENDGKTVVCATHATPIRIMQTMVQKGDLSKMKDVSWVSNASVSVYSYQDGKWTAEVVSYDKHLENLKTNLPSNV